MGTTAAVACATMQRRKQSAARAKRKQSTGEALGSEEGNRRRICRSASRVLPIGAHTSTPSERDKRAMPTGALTSVPDTVQEVSRRKPYNAKTATRAQRWLHWWVIDPRTSKAMGRWDIATVLALVFVALVTPFEVAFLDSPESASDLIARFGSVGWLFFIKCAAATARVATARGCYSHLPSGASLLAHPLACSTLLSRRALACGACVRSRAVDALFTVDLVLQFRLMYAESNSSEGARWVRRAAPPD